jgi:hypothetical protein
MRLSDLVSRLDDAMAWVCDRTGSDDIVVAVSSPDSRRRAFSGISSVPDVDGDIAVVSFIDGDYGEAGMTTVKLRALIMDFMGDHGDLEVAIRHDRELFRRVDVNVDQETDDYGDPVGWVAIVQAYFLKPASNLLNR